MGRAKFSITTKENKRNFLKYLENNEEKVLHDLFSYYNNKGEDGIAKREAFIAKWHKYKSPSYILDTPIEKYYSDLTELLYLLPEKVISRIKVSLRANRNRSSSAKTQLTIDTGVYDDLSSFAKQHKLTLSDALGVLLENSKKVKACDNTKSLNNFKEK